MASLYAIRGKDNGQHFAIRGSNATIGRESSNQIQLRDTEVSRQHARIVRTGPSQFEIVDNHSSNGTFVNSRRIKSQILRSGDRVQVGRTLLIFTGGPEPYSTRSLDDVMIVPQNEPNELELIRSSLESQSVLVAPDSLSDVGSQTLDPAELSSQDVDATGWEIVYQVSQAINRTIDLNELLLQVLDLIFQWIQCDRGCILMLDDVAGQLTPIHSRDRKTEQGSDSAGAMAKPLRISRTILEHVVQTKEGVLTSDAQDDSRWQGAESVASLGIHEAICVPMSGRYGLVGAIYVDTSTSPGVFAQKQAGNAFNDQHLKLMLAIAGQAALAIEDTQFYRAMVQSERLAVMGQTIANLSHHVKNILQGVSGGNFLVEEGLRNGDLEIIRKGWKLVERNQARISNLVMDMLSYSKDREPQLQWQDLRETLDDVLALVQPRANEFHVQLIWDRPAIPLDAEFDAEGIHRAVLNVLTNAVDATIDHELEDSQKHVRVEAETADGNATITVRDNGIGISEEDAQRVFAPFESNKGARGTGLGLPVSQKTLREHGGDLTFESNPEGGTTFKLQWPIGNTRGPTTQLG